MNILSLSESELQFGYKDIVLYYENEIKKDKTGFNKKNLKKFLDSTSIVLKAKVTPSSTFQNKKISFLHYTSPNGTSEIVSIFKHLRNCYAHGNVEKREIHKKLYLCFKDVKISSNTEQTTMIGQIARNKFEDFVKELKKARQ